MTVEGEKTMHVATWERSCGVVGKLQLGRNEAMML